jgi:hypothetical protein
MASHFVSLNRGQEGFQPVDFVTGTASAANVGLELRLDDAAGYRRVDVVRQLEAFIRFFEDRVYNETGATGFAAPGFQVVD